MPVGRTRGARWRWAMGEVLVQRAYESWGPGSCVSWHVLFRHVLSGRKTQTAYQMRVSQKRPSKRGSRKKRRPRIKQIDGQQQQQHERQEEKPMKDRGQLGNLFVGHYNKSKINTQQAKEAGSRCKVEGFTGHGHGK